MTQLQPGDKVRLIGDGPYSTLEGFKGVCYVKEVFDHVAILTSCPNLSLPDHYLRGHNFCLAFIHGRFEPLPKERKGFVGFIRKLEGVA